VGVEAQCNRRSSFCYVVRHNTVEHRLCSLVPAAWPLHRCQTARCPVPLLPVHPSLLLLLLLLLPLWRVVLHR
jgi:hypothetical protein